MIRLAHKSLQVFNFKKFSSKVIERNMEVLSEKQKKDIEATIKHLQCPIPKKSLQLASIPSTTGPFDEHYLYSNLDVKEGTEPRIVAYKIVDGLVCLRSVDAQILPAIK